MLITTVSYERNNVFEFCKLETQIFFILKTKRNRHLLSAFLPFELCLRVKIVATLQIVSHFIIRSFICYSQVILVKFHAILLRETILKRVLFEKKKILLSLFFFVKKNLFFFFFNYFYFIIFFNTFIYIFCISF